MANDSSPERRSGDTPLDPLLSKLVYGCLLSPGWNASVDAGTKLQVLQGLRWFLRHPDQQAQVIEREAVPVVVSCLQSSVEACSTAGAAGSSTEQFSLAVECMAIIKLLAGTDVGLEALARAGAHQVLLSLARSSNPSFLPGLLVPLLGFARHPQHCMLVAAPSTLDLLLKVLQQEGSAGAYIAGDVLALLSQHQDLIVNFLAVSTTHRIIGLMQQLATPLATILLRIVSHLAVHPAAGEGLYLAGGVVALLRQLEALLEQHSSQHGAKPHAANMMPPIKQIQLAVGSLAQLCSLHKEAALQACRANGMYHIGRVLCLGFSKSARTGTDDVNKPDTGQVITVAKAHAVRALHHMRRADAGCCCALLDIFPKHVTKHLHSPATTSATWSECVQIAQAFDGMSSTEQNALRAAVTTLNKNRSAIRKSVGGYDIIDILGKGGYGTVYKARRRSGDTMVALKEVPLSEASPTVGSAAQHSPRLGLLNKEVVILSSLMHPHIVQYHESFHSQGCLYIAMELVEGKSLMEHIKQLSKEGRHMQEADIWRVVIAVLLALNYIHSVKRIVHRDLTPGNIILSHDDSHGTSNVKVTDFGLARRLAAKSVCNHSVLGTMPYTSPEIIQQDAVSDKADIWSLGCVLYHMLMLQAPFDGSNPLCVASRIVEGAYEPVVDPPTGPPYSAQLKQLVPVLLTVDPHKRPSTGEVAALLSTQLMAELDRLHAKHELVCSNRPTVKY